MIGKKRISLYYFGLEILNPVVHERGVTIPYLNSNDNKPSSTVQGMYAKMVSGAEGRDILLHFFKIKDNQIKCIGHLKVNTKNTSNI